MSTFTEATATPLSYSIIEYGNIGYAINVTTVAGTSTIKRSNGDVRVFGSRSSARKAIYRLKNNITR